MFHLVGVQRLQTTLEASELPFDITKEPPNQSCCKACFKRNTSGCHSIPIERKTFSYNPTVEVINKDPSKNSCEAFIINLSRRPDRKDSALRELSKIGMNHQVIPAIDASSEQDSQFLTSDFVTKYVEACWLSHRKAISSFLDSKSQFGLIVEDDLVLSPNVGESILKVLANNESEIDFLQIGFLSFGRIDHAVLRKAEKNNRFNVLLWMLKDVRALKFLSLPTRARVKEAEIAISMRRKRLDIVPNQIRPGAHCYLINRKFANAMMEINKPVFFSTDQLYMSLGEMRIFKMARLARSEASQSQELGSDILARFRSHDNSN